MSGNKYILNSGERIPCSRFLSGCCEEFQCWEGDSCQIAWFRPDITDFAYLTQSTSL